MMLREAKMFDGVADLIHYLNKKGIPWGVATAGDPAQREILFEKYAELHDTLGAFVTCADVGKNKPDPTVFHECMKRLNITP